MSKASRPVMHNGVEYRVTGRRRLPCGHQAYRPGDDDFDGFDRTCDTCHRTFVGAIEHSDLLTEKCGRPVAAIVWDDDPIQIRLQAAKDEATVRTVKKKRVTNGGRPAPRTPSTDQPRPKITRVGPPK